MALFLSHPTFTPGCSPLDVGCVPFHFSAHCHPRWDLIVCTGLCLDSTEDFSSSAGTESVGTEMQSAGPHNH